MTAAELVGVGAAGGAGAIARFALDGAISARTASGFPYGTLIVNLFGCVILGIFTGAALHGAPEELAGTGLVGAFTTFSTWMLETHRLGEDRRGSHGAANLAVSLVLGLVAAWAGQRLGVAL